MNTKQSVSDFIGYEKLITSIVDQGYSCVCMGEFQPESRHLLLRHDVDLNFEAAVKMAKIEQLNGWKSIFFVLLSTEFYNLFSRTGRKNLNKILSLGHQVGLHYDISVYPNTKPTEQYIQEECETLERLIDKSVDYVAPHRPSSYCKEILNNETSIANRIHPYQPRYFANNKYIAESPGHWSHGHPLDNENFKAGNAIQLLTHPHLWISLQDERDLKIQISIEQQKQLLVTEAKLNFNGFEISPNHRRVDK